SRWSLTTAPGRCKRGTKCDQTQQHGRITHVQQEDKQIRVRRRRQRPAFPQPPPVAERLERNPLSLTILSLIQIALTPRFMVRAPKGLTVTLARPASVRHLFLPHFAKRPVRTDRVRQAQNKRANNGRLL